MRIYGTEFRLLPRLVLRFRQRMFLTHLFSKRGILVFCPLVLAFYLNFAQPIIMNEIGMVTPGSRWRFCIFHHAHFCIIHRAMLHREYWSRNVNVVHRFFKAKPIWLDSLLSSLCCIGETSPFKKIPIIPARTV